ncbi:MAG: geranylgeranyl reductase family protein [Myxococcota bacterium]|nr:geranylgeranyl reductase family protein [Myxococcota bacterium]
MGFDVVVVGAGPGGASAAYHLATAGLRVALLERRSFPRDKSCGDGITRSGVKLLREMGVLDEIPYVHVIRGVAVHMQGKGSRDFPFPLDRYPGTEALTIPRRMLDAAICRQATRAGAELFERVRVRDPLIEDGAIVGVIATDSKGEPMTFRGRAIVAADGATSHLARRAGLRSAPDKALGIAIRGYYEGISGLDDRMAFYLLLKDATDRKLLPSYGWVFPTGPHTANIGIGLFERVKGENINQLMARFLERLRSDDRFAAMSLTGTLMGAPLRFDFDPERSAKGRMLLVGDAAGLVSPFTGEGISYALESGRIAADTIRRTLARHSDGTRCGDDYSLRLAQRFAGYFESGRHSGRRYRMVWKALSSTFQSERPLHRIARRLVLVPDAIDEAGQGELLQEVGPLLPKSIDVQGLLIRVADLLNRTVRKDWPFLARLGVGRIGPGSTPFRPSLLTILSAQFGDPNAPGVPEVGAAVELGALSMFAHASISDQITADGNAFTLLVAEFLLAKGYELASRTGTGATAQLAEAISRAVQGRIQQQRRAFDLEAQRTTALETLRLITGTLGALPCHLGASVAGAPLAAIGPLSEYGENLALAYSLVDECRVIEGATDATADVLLADIGDGIWGVTVQAALGSEPSAAKRLAELLSAEPIDPMAVKDVIAATNATDRVRQEAIRASERAQEVLTSLPSGAPQTALLRLARYAVDRDVPSGDLHEMLAEMG